MPAVSAASLPKLHDRSTARIAEFLSCASSSLWSVRSDAAIIFKHDLVVIVRICSMTGTRRARNGPESPVLEYVDIESILFQEWRASLK